MFSTASIRKGKKTSIGSYDQEQTRVMGDGQEEWQNPNIDTEMPRTHAIQVVENAYDGSVKAAIEGRIADAGVKRVRKDAVTHLTAFATMPDYSRRSEPEREQFEKSFKQFLEKKYGAGNVVDMRWHFDETTPHLHATVVPITSDGRLCAKELFKPTKRAWSNGRKTTTGKSRPSSTTPCPTSGARLKRATPSRPKPPAINWSAFKAEKRRLNKTLRSLKRRSSRNAREVEDLRKKVKSLENEREILRARSKDLELTLDGLKRLSGL